MNGTFGTEGADAEGSAADHRAVLLQEDSPAHMVELERLRDEGATCVDHLAGQLVGLRELGGRPESDEPPRWVYYPWRRTAVRVLGPRSFARLRLDRNRNKITAEEQSRLGEVTVGVVGLSVGHAVAHALALEGACGTLRLADFDILELSNLNRLPASLLDLGLNKAVIAARRIAELDPYLPVEVWGNGVGPGDVAAFVEGLDVLVDECDSLDIKVRLRLEASRRCIPVVMETSDRGMVDVERFDLEPERPPFHGLLGDIDVEALSGLTSRDKVPYVLRLLGPTHLSTRLAASMLEVDETLHTWPQLGGDVALGGATVVAAIRRIVLGAPLRSGRGRVDLDEHLDRLKGPELPMTDSRIAGSTPTVPDDPVDAVVAAAVRAPSGGNSQPWSIVVHPDRVTFGLAAEPAPVRMDLHRRGSWVAIGAALHNARVAAAAHGILGSVRIGQGDGGAWDAGFPLATIEFGDTTEPNLAAQYEAVFTRGTNRHPFRAEEMTATEIAALEDAAEREGGRLHVVTDRAVLRELSGILAESDRIRYITEGLRHDMIAELRRPHEDVTHGIDVASLGLDASERAMLDVVLRHDVLDQLGRWDLGGGLGRITRDRVRDSAALVVVPVSGKTPAQYIGAGVAVESVWLRAHTMGLGVQPISPIFLYADDHEDLMTLSKRHAGLLAAASAEFAGHLGLDAGDTPALVMRIGRTSGGFVRSERRSDRTHRVVPRL